MQPDRVPLNASTEAGEATPQTLTCYDRDHLWHPWTANAHAARGPLMAAGEGCYLFDTAGRRYLDARSGALNATVGYGRAEVVEAVASQMHRLMTYDLTAGSTAPAILAARRIAELMPAPLSRTLFVNSGSEVTEAAVKIARMYHALRGQPDRRWIISVRDGYHGATLGARAATGAFFRRRGSEPLPRCFATIPAPRCVGCAAATAHTACRVPGAEALSGVIREIGAGRVAAFVVEPCSGWVVSSSFLPATWPASGRYATPAGCC